MGQSAGAHRLTTRATSPADLTTGRRLRLMAVASASVAVVVGTMSALYTTLTDIGMATGATPTQLTWIVDAYTLALAALVLGFGAVGDRIGRRRALLVGLAIFALASLLPTAFTTPGWIIAARALAGAGAALVMPSSLSLLTATFPEDRRSGAVGLWAGVAGAGATLGVLGSGVLVQHYSWQALFVAFAILGGALFLAALTVPESRAAERRHFDLPGTVFSAAAVGGLVFALIEGPERGWSSASVLGGAAVAVVGLIGFIAIELRTAEPLLELRLFRRRGFAAGALGVLMQFLVTFGLFLLLVQFLQRVRGYDPLGSALAMAPMAVPLLVLSVVAPAIAQRVGLRVVTGVGMTIMVAGLVWFAQITPDSDYVAILYPMLVVSVGMGICAAPATAAIVNDCPVSEHGVAAAVNDAAREIGAAIGIAVAGSTVAGRYDDEIAPWLDRVPEAARELVSRSPDGASAVAERMGPAGNALVDAARLAYTDGVGHSLLVLAVVAAVGTVAATVLAPGRRARREVEDDAGAESAGVPDDAAATSPEPDAPAGSARVPSSARASAE